ncbi:unnamed protein product [Effrenium voratum]|nr:unnamed protein product [Effrenium voratum]
MRGGPPPPPPPHPPPSPILRRRAAMTASTPSPDTPALSHPCAVLAGISFAAGSWDESIKLWNVPQAHVAHAATLASQSGLQEAASAAKDTVRPREGETRAENPHLKPQEEPQIGILPTTKWEDISLQRGLLEELRANDGIRAVCREIGRIANDVEVKAQELPFVVAEDLVKNIGEHQLQAILAYTHDLQAPSGKAGNLYFELNNALRKRGVEDRASMMRTWGPFVCYALKGMGQLPAHQGVVYRGMPGKDFVLSQYKKGRPIQWGAFSSTSTSKASSVQFMEADGVLLKIDVQSGRKLGAISFFPQEEEVILSPNCRFVVTSDSYEQDGVTLVDLVETTTDAFIS